MRRTEKNGTVDSVRCTYKLCCYSNTFNCGHSVFNWYESTLAVHPENPLMVSNLTTGNSGQLKMSAKFRPSQKRRFWIWPIKRLLFSLAVKMLNFWGPKKYKKVINSSTKCLISVKIAIMTPHIIPLPLVNVWLIFDLQKYVNWLCVFSKVNPFFQKAQVFCMDLQPAADPYNVVCRPIYDVLVAVDHTHDQIIDQQLRVYNWLSWTWHTKVIDLEVGEGNP